LGGRPLPRVQHSHLSINGNVFTERGFFAETMMGRLGAKRRGVCGHNGAPNVQSLIALSGD